MKPDLTAEQKERFDSAFKEIVEMYASDEVKLLWKNNGDLKWVGNEVIIKPDNFENKLRGRGASEYTALENRRINRTL